LSYIARVPFPGVLLTSSRRQGVTAIQAGRGTACRSLGGRCSS
jgi:hypothetical protein